MAFDLHAFISYAHIDNEPLEPGQLGWVSRFHAVLKTRLSQRLGEPAQLWRDDKLRGDDVFDDEIRAVLPRSALMVSILTPRYVRSGWCQSEMDEFAAAAFATGGVQVRNKTRMIRVLKTPLAPGDTLPPVLARSLGHPFFREEGDRQVEIDPAFGESERQEFLRRVSELAVVMADNLRALAQTQPAAGSVAGVPAPGQIVFLAECGRDLQAVRAQLATDLRLHGHTVLPDQQLSLNEDLLRPELAAVLASATLAVHLVGGSAGPVPEGPTGLSLVALQNALAAAASQARGLRRIIWLAPGAKAERPEQQAYLQTLPTDAALQCGADLLQGDVEALKAAVHHALQGLQQPAPPPTPATGTGPRVHLLMTEADRANVLPLVKALRAMGLAVSVPVFAGDAAELRQRNAQLVAESRAVLVVYAAGDEAWKFHQLSDLQKQAAMAGGGPARFLALLPPITPDKQLEQALADAATLDLLAGFNGHALAALGTLQ